MEDLLARRTADEQPVLVAGHRGMMALYPENTLLSFQEAINAGVDMLEFDLNLSSDKEVVVIHDNTVERTTNGTGAVRDMTLKQLKLLDAGGKFQKQFEGLKIPTLKEYCELVRSYTQLLHNVEIKERTRETVDISVKILDEYGLIGNCVFTCFDAEILEYLHDKHGLCTQGFPAEYMSNFGPGTYDKMYAAGIAIKPFKGKPDMRTLTRETVSEFSAMGIIPWCFCPDDEGEARRVIDCGARLLTCNNPIPAIRLLGRAKSGK